MLIGLWNTCGTAVEAAPATDEKRNNVGNTANNERKRFIEPTTPQRNYNPDYKSQTMGL